MFFFFSSRRRHTRCYRDWSSDVCSSDLLVVAHEDPEKVRWARELQRRYPPEAGDPHGVAYVISTGEPEFFPKIPPELLDESIGDDEELRRIVTELGIHSSLCVPLSARG